MTFLAVVSSQLHNSHLPTSCCPVFFVNSATIISIPVSAPAGWCHPGRCPPPVTPLRPNKLLSYALLGLTDRQHIGQNDLHQWWRHACTQHVAARSETGNWLCRCRRPFGDGRWRKDGRTDSRPVSDCPCSSGISHRHRIAARYTLTRLQSPHSPAIQLSTTPAISTN